jgi:SAM-dependent methyltransferase
MENINDITIKTYKEGFNKYEERTPKEVSGDFREWINSFTSYLPENGTILELGSATGRDARYFASKGYKVTCTDIVPEALKKLSQEGFETSEFDFRNEPKEEWSNHFDGFFANAVLLHAPNDVFKKAVANILKVLKKNGVAGFSLKTGEGEEITEEKMDAPRYFNYHNEEEIRNILSGLPFEIISISHADQNKWLHVIVKVK